MRINKEFFDAKRIKVGIIISIFTAAGITGSYLFFNIQDTSDISGIPVAVPVYDQSDKYKPIVSGDGIANTSNEQLNSKSYNSENFRGRQKKELEPVVNGSGSDDSVKNDDNMNLNELFKDSVINQHTLNVADMLQTEFGSSSDDLYLHYSQVEEFLKAQLNDDSKIDEFLNFYKKYTEYKLAQVTDPNFLWLEIPENPEEAMRLNNEKQQYLREVFGRETADTLWGNESKIHEYKMKELGILRTDSYSPQVKEQLINDLRAQTFGDETIQEDTDYNYQLYLKLAIYSDELSRMTEDERLEKIKEFRNEIFPPDKLKFMEFLEGVVETEPEEANGIEQDAR